MHGVLKDTLNRIIKQVIDGINDILFNEVVAWPSGFNYLAFHFSTVLFIYPAKAFLNAKNNRAKTINAKK